MAIKLIVGLGNPGKPYVATRHNIGRRVVEALQKAKPEGVWLFIPDSFMNVSGSSVAEFARRKACPPEAMLIVSDDFELPLGTLRLRRKGSSGGHNGLKSIFEALGTQGVPRLRIGIGPVPEGQDPKEFVLKPFSKSEEKKLKDEIIPRAQAAALCAASEGIDKAMNEFNAVSENA